LEKREAKPHIHGFWGRKRKEKKKEEKKGNGERGRGKEGKKKNK